MSPAPEGWDHSSLPPHLALTSGSLETYSEGISSSSDAPMMDPSTTWCCMFVPARNLPLTLHIPSQLAGGPPEACVPSTICTTGYLECSFCIWPWCGISCTNGLTDLLALRKDITTHEKTLGEHFSSLRLWWKCFYHTTFHNQFDSLVCFIVVVCSAECNRKLFSRFESQK